MIQPYFLIFWTRLVQVFHWLYRKAKVLSGTEKTYTEKNHAKQFKSNETAVYQAFGRKIRTLKGSELL